MTSTHGPAQRVSANVIDSVQSLPSRYIPGRLSPGIGRTYHLQVGPRETWSVVADADRCTVWPGGAGPADALIRVDPRSWLDLIGGRVSGVELFFRGALEVEGDLNEALRLDTLFARPAGSPWEAWHPEVRDVHVDLPMVGGRTGRVRLEAYTVGPTDAPAVVFIHGLGASKVSLLPAMAGLARSHRVIGIDLPGFGHSEARVDAPYSVAWLAAAVRGVLAALALGPAVLVGNSLGGRLSVEVALADPAQVRGVALLCPAVGFKEYRTVAPVLRLTRPDIPLAALPWLSRTGLTRRVVDRLLREMFADPSRVPAQNLIAARDDALRILRSASRRYALLATARQIGREHDRDYWARLANLSVPSLWIFGDSDVLVSPTYARPVREILPDAQVEVWGSTGHIPQFEHRQRTADRLADFIAALPRG